MRCRIGIIFALAFALACSAWAASTPEDLAKISGAGGKQLTKRDDFNFVVMSDRTGGKAAGEWEQAVDEVNLLQPDFVMSVGDYIPGGARDQQALDKEWDEFDAIVAKINAPFFTCVGNHDVYPNYEIKVDPVTQQAVLVLKENDPQNGSLETYIKRHGVKGKTYYSFDYRGSHFVVLDSIMLDDPKRADEQLTWLARDMKKASKAKHVFVFFHVPLLEQSWPGSPQTTPVVSAIAQRVYALFPQGKTTVFNGHWHQMCYIEISNIPTYILSSSGAGSGNVRATGDFRMFARVAVNSGKPTIAIIPTNEIMPADAAPMARFIAYGFSPREGLAMTGEGGKLSFPIINTDTRPLTMTVAWRAPQWQVTPATQTVTIPAGEQSIITFECKPIVAKATDRLTMITTLSWPGREPFTREDRVELVPIGTLARVAPMTLDGTLEKWATIPAMEINRAKQIFTGEENWGGQDESSAKVRVATDGDNLYVGVEVTDDDVLTDSKVPWEGDGIELFWDARPEKDRTSKLLAGTGQFGLCPGKDDAAAGPGTFIAYHQFGQAVPKSVTTAYRRTPTGYFIEMKLPTTALGLKEGDKIGDVGIDLALDDKDAQGPLAAQTRLSLTGHGDSWQLCSHFIRLRAAK